MYFELQCKFQASDNQIHWRSLSEIPFVLNIWRKKISPTERKTIRHIYICCLFVFWWDLCFFIFDSIGFFCSRPKYRKVWISVQKMWQKLNFFQLNQLQAVNNELIDRIFPLHIIREREKKLKYIKLHLDTWKVFEFKTKKSSMSSSFSSLCVFIFRSFIVIAVGQCSWIFVRAKKIEESQSGK